MFINSALVSAQNRQRLYWFNWNANQPEDRGILLEDIIELFPTNPTYMSEKFTERNKDWGCLVNPYTKLKASCLSAREYEKNGRQGDYILQVRGLKETYRKLTPLECERLQTVPEGYTEGVSNTQRYKMLGNGWTVEVISHLLQHM